VAMIFSFFAMIFWLVASFFKWISNNLVAAADFVAEYGFSITGSLVDIFDKQNHQ
jgi:hypothetical protein